jgi:hypothetical protein
MSGLGIYRVERPTASAHVPPSHPSRRRSLHPTDSGHLGWAAGTGHHAPFPPFRQNSIRHHWLPERSTENRRSRLWGSVFLRRVGSDQGPKNLEKALDGAARAEGLHGYASAFAQEEQFVGEQLGIA